jgi:hypothetical protein
MKRVLPAVAAVLACALTGMLSGAPAQVSDTPRAGQQTNRGDEPVRLPNGKLQSEEILKEDYKKNLKDAQDLIELAESLKTGLEKNEQHVLSLADLKKTEDIEKIARRIRGRMRRY